MLSALPPLVAGLVALLALALLPGLALVRAPWPAVPALSWAFWTLTWWWVPVASRGRALEFGLLAFAVLASLRLLPKHVVPPPPGYTGPPPPPPVTGPLTGTPPRLRSGPSLAVVAVGLVLLAPVLLLEHVPGREMAFHTTAARAAWWRDALPSTLAPLLPLEPFGAHPAALSLLAADVGLLSGLGPGRSVALVTLASVALLLVALFSLCAVRLPPRAAALAAVLGLAVVRWPGAFAVWGEGGELLALAFGVTAAALLLGHSSRPSAVGAGLLLAAGLLAQPLLTLGLGAVLVFVARPRPPLGWAWGVAWLLATPGLWRTVRSLSPHEAWGVLRALEWTAVADALLGLALLVAAAFLAARLEDSGAQGRARVRSATLLVAGGLLLVLRVTVGLGAGQLPPATLGELANLDHAGHPLEAVCAPGPLIDWVPALAGRPPGEPGPGAPEPWIPHALREEWARRSPRGCSKTLDPVPAGH